MLRVFVYGTLKKGFPLDPARHNPAIEKIRIGIEPATIKGTLYDMIYFPAVKLGGDSIVEGEVHTYISDEILPLFDSIESEGFMYKRKIVEITTSTGTHKAIVYEYIDELDDYNIIHDGIWRGPERNNV